MSTIFYLLLLFIHCVCPSMERSQQKYKEFTPGTIVRIEDLKPEKRKKNSMVHQRARMMSHSFGIVMDPPIQLNKKSATEIRVKWIGDDAVSLGINPRYLQLFPQLMIHALPHEEENVVNMTNLFDSLWKSACGNAYPVPDDHNGKQVLTTSLKIIHAQHIPPGLSSDEIITYDILCTWILPPKGSNKSLSHNLHVINQESRYSDFLSMPQLIKISKLLPSELPLAKLFDKGIVRKSWAKATLPMSPIIVLAMDDCCQYVEIVQRQLQWYKQEMGENLTKPQKVPSFIIHNQPSSARAESDLIESLAKDSKNIILVWPLSKNVNAKHKNVFYQRPFSRTLYNNNVCKHFENFKRNDFLLDAHRLAESLLYLFAAVPISIMDKIMIRMEGLFAFVPYSSYWTGRVKQLSTITSDSEIDYVKNIITHQFDARKMNADFRQNNLSFWKQFATELKRALLRMQSINLKHSLNNAMAFEAIRFWDGMKHFLDGTFALHIISGSDAVFNKRNMKQLASFSRTPAAFKSFL